MDARRRWAVLLLACGCLVWVRWTVLLGIEVVVEGKEATPNDPGKEDPFGGCPRGYEYEAPEPYPWLHGIVAAEGGTARRGRNSPDPLVDTRWAPWVNTSRLQAYRVHRPVGYRAVPEGCAGGIASLWPGSSDADDNASNDRCPPLSSEWIWISGNCTLVLDWGVERAAWMELISPTGWDGTAMEVTGSISENNRPYPGKERGLTRYGEHTYRLETNPQLYEGVRFGFLNFRFSGTAAAPVALEGVSLVAKIKPMNYTGSFSSSDGQLTRAWYTGAYGVRLNTEEDGFNSVLIERGDRVAIQGDGHPTIDAALVAFFPLGGLVRNVLERTDSARKHVVDDDILAYPLLWCSSLLDYFWASGDETTFRRLLPDATTILDRRIHDFLDPDLDIAWFGWDDRLGNGWCFHKNHDRCTDEALLAFAGLVARVCCDLARALRASGWTDLADRYEADHRSLVRRFRAEIPDWPSRLGVHAAANAILAGIPASHEETEKVVASTLNDAVTLCSFSPFNQYWILQALGHADRMDHALASIGLCWGPMMALGNGCFWEIFSPEWASFLGKGDLAPHLPSYCHPWSSGVTAWLSHTMGGVVPLRLGYTAFAALPYVSGKHPSVRTTVPTPHGPIGVEATLVREEDPARAWFRATVSSPVPGIVGIRFNLTDHTTTATTDGESSPNDDRCDYYYYALVSESIAVARGNHSLPLSAMDPVRIRALLGDSPRTRAHLYVRVPPGTLRVSALYRRTPVVGKPPPRTTGSEPFPDPVYPAGRASLDRVSQGNGLRIHGRDGYLLLGCDPQTGGDLLRLPAYVSNVTVLQHGFPGWFAPTREHMGESASNPVFLPIDRRSSPEARDGDPAEDGRDSRALGMVGPNQTAGGEIHCLFVRVDLTNAPQRGSDAVVVEKNLDLGYSISLYFVAKSPTNRHAIRAMDGDSRNVIAPTTLIEDYEKGVWWTLRYNGPLHLRLMNMKGIHLSAIAFESDEKRTHQSEA